MELISHKSRIIVGDSVSLESKTCCNLCYVVEGLIEGILHCNFKEMSLDIKSTDLKSFIIFEYLLNNFWVIKSIEYCWKKVTKMSGFFFVMGFLVLKGKLLI